MNVYDESVVITEKGFWSAINVYLNKPNIANKRLWGSRVIAKLFMNLQPDNKIIVHDNTKFQSVEDFSSETSFLKFLKDNYNLEQQLSGENVVEIILIELLPKIYSDSHAYNMVCKLKNKEKVIFFDVTPENLKHNLCPTFAYSFLLQNNTLTLNSYGDSSSKTYQWLTTSLFPQVIKWGYEVINKGKFSLESLSLVSSDKYYIKYNELKFKYGKEMVKIWPESTDPAKFVYEDVAISAYLLLLWEDERKQLSSDKLQSFVDLGCGNGLLVFILTSEGHPGLGIDVRKRNIWDTYPKNIQLEERTIEPSNFNLFPDTDWIIGNHSDELTPWIPVLTLRSSYQCRFFLLPCCAYNFDGSKYQRKDSSKSQYMDYLEYIENLCIECGFNTEIDRLKIPSTKRISFIGRHKNYLFDQHDNFCKKIQSIINNTSLVGNEKDHWIPDFKAREPTEKVRNCTRLDKDLLQGMVKRVTEYLLYGTTVESDWCLGRSATILELVQLFPTDTLKKLKAECGGLQTLLRNNSHIFKVQSGTVELKYPKSVSEVNNTKSKNSSSTFVKKKVCWFYSNHPQGCPLSDTHCSYKHLDN